MREFTLESAGSEHRDPRVALSEALDAVVARTGPRPDLMIVSASSAYDVDLLAPEFRDRGMPNVHGFTSCLGCMTQEGVHGRDGFGVGVFGITDPDGSYGTAIQPMDENPREAGREAVRRAFGKADRSGELPGLILVNATPGSEEEVLAGIQEIVGPWVPILGGTAADNEVDGKWSVFGLSGSEPSGVAVSVLFPSVDITYAFRSGYQPDGPSGTVTAAEGRVLKEIDHRPAALVYNGWSGGVLDAVLPEGGSALPLTSLNPLGRAVGKQDGIVRFRLSHPERVLPDGSLVLFTNVQEGEELYSMRGSPDSLVARGARVVASAIECGPFAGRSPRGALITYCAGCMLTVRGRLDEVCDGIRAVVPGMPFLGSFTFGEQGCFLGGDNCHSNLMISAIVFGS